MKASGEFEVNLQPLDSFTSGSAGIQLNRMSITKTFTGDLSGESLGEMLSARTTTQGSAGYVAIEQVVGTLHGRQGTFVLQHYGVSNRGEQQLILEVVPDSGTGSLEMLTGMMTIHIEDGKHHYTFDYSLPGSTPAGEIRVQDSPASSDAVR